MRSDYMYGELRDFFQGYFPILEEILTMNKKGKDGEKIYENNILLFLKNKDKILIILKFYYVNQILVYSQRNKLEVVDEKLIEVLYFHKSSLHLLLKKIKKSELYSFPIFSYFYNEDIKNVSVTINISTKKNDSQIYGAYNIKFHSGDLEIFLASFYIGKDCIFLANLQHLKGSKDFLEIMKYHRIVFLILEFIGANIGIMSIFTYSNLIHPSKLGKEHNGFNGTYDTISKSLGLSIGNSGFYEGILGEKITFIPFFYRETVEYHMKNIVKYF